MEAVTEAVTGAAMEAATRAGGPETPDTNKRGKSMRLRMRTKDVVRSRAHSVERKRLMIWMTLMIPPALLAVLVWCVVAFGDGRHDERRGQGHSRQERGGRP